MKPPKIFAYESKVIWMQRIADYVRTGHQAYIAGKSEESKVFVTLDKLVAENPVYDDKLKAFRAREKGEPTGRLLLWIPPEGTHIHWILLMHATTDQLSKTQKWLHAEDPHSRVNITGYELVRETRPEKEKPVWTWRYRRDRYEDLRDSIVLAIRSNRDQDLKILIDKLAGTVGFSGCREQAKKIIDLIKSEWANHRASDKMPALPALIGWTRRKANKGIWIYRPKMLPPPKKEKQINIKDWMLPSNPDFDLPVLETTPRTPEEKAAMLAAYRQLADQVAAEDPALSADLHHILDGKA